MNKRYLIKRLFSPCFLKTGIQRDHHRYQVMTDQSSCLRFLPRMAATASSDSSLCSPPHSPGRNCQPELSLAWCLISSAPALSPGIRWPLSSPLSLSSLGITCVTLSGSPGVSPQYSPDTQHRPILRQASFAMNAAFYFTVR